MSFRQRAWHMFTRGNQVTLIRLIKKTLFYGFLIVSGSLTYAKFYKSKLIFSFEKNQENMNLIKHNKAFYGGVYSPTFFLIPGILQRCYKKYLQKQPYFPAQREQATAQRFAISQIPILNQRNYKQNPSIIVFLSGSEGIDNNIKYLSSTLSRHGFRVICLDIDDFYNQKRLQTTLMYIKNKHKAERIYGVGIEYGANLLLNLAGSKPQIFNGIASIGNPLKIDQTQKKIENSNFLWKTFLYKDILKGRIQKQLQRQRLMKINNFSEQIKNETSVYQLDKYIYNIQNDEKLKKFKQQNSSLYSIQKLKTNTLFIQSLEDPFSIQFQNEEPQVIQNNKCIYVETHRGGHNQWFQSSHTTRWIYRPLIFYFKLLDLKQ